MKFNYELAQELTHVADIEVKKYFKEVDKDQLQLLDLCLYRRVEELTRRILPFGVRELIKDYVGRNNESEEFYRTFVHPRSIWFGVTESLYYKESHYKCAIEVMRRNLRNQRCCVFPCGCVNYSDLFSKDKLEEWIRRIIYVWSIYKTKNELCNLNN